MYEFLAKKPLQFLPPILKGFYVDKNRYPILQGALEKLERNR